MAAYHRPALEAFGDRVEVDAVDAVAQSDEQSFVWASAVMK